MAISLCMIVKDEAAVLDSFLKRIKKYVDEIIIVDTGSNDSTKIIASRHTPNVYDFRWKDDFSSARNFSISKANKDWILWLDPDEEISEEDLKKLKDLTENKKFLGYRFIQETLINDKKYVQGICKLFQNKKGIEFIYPIHESVMPSIKKKGGNNGKTSFSRHPRKLGGIGKTGIIIKHESKYDLKKAQYYLKLIEKKAEKWPESSADKEKEIIIGITNQIRLD